MFTVKSEFGILMGDSRKRDYISWVKQNTYLLSNGANDFFGTPRHSLEVVNSLVLVGMDSNWPCPNEKWWARVFDVEGPSDHHIGDRFATKNEAIKAAKEFANTVLTAPENN